MSPLLILYSSFFFDSVIIGTIYYRMSSKYIHCILLLNHEGLCQCSHKSGIEFLDSRTANFCCLLKQCHFMASIEKRKKLTLCMLLSSQLWQQVYVDINKNTDVLQASGYLCTPLLHNCIFCFVGFVIYI